MEDVPAFEIEAEVTWMNVSSLRAWGHNGIYDAFMIHFAAAPSKEPMGGYFGVQAHSGNDSGDMLLSSLWDQNPGQSEKWQAAIPKHPNCKRNCNDCGDKPHNDSNAAPDGTTGTQCKMYIPFMPNGVNFRLHIERIAVNQSAYMYNRTWIGDEYEVSIRHVQSNISWIVGTQLVSTSFSGIDQMDTFCEHIGCTPCKAFEFASRRRGPWVLKPSGSKLVKAWSQQHDDEEWICKAQEITAVNVGEIELKTGTLQDYNSSYWNVDPLYVCNATSNGCSYPGNGVV